MTHLDDAMGQPGPHSGSVSCSESNSEPRESGLHGGGSVVGARSLLENELDLQPGARLLVLAHPDAQSCLPALEAAAAALGVVTRHLNLGPLALATEQRRDQLIRDVRRADGVLLLGGSDTPAAIAASRHITRQAPEVSLLAIPHGCLDVFGCHGLPTGTVPGQGNAAARRLTSLLALAEHIAITNPSGTSLRVSVNGRDWQHCDGRLQGRTHQLRLPAEMVVSRLKSADGLVVPTSSTYLDNGDPDPLAVGLRMQVRRASIRAVEGVDGTAWMSRAVHRTPGCRITHIGFGTRAPLQLSAPSRVASVTRAGVFVTMVSSRRELAGPGDAPFVGTTFCLRRAEVTVDGMPIMRDGAFLDPVA